MRGKRKREREREREWWRKENRGKSEKLCFDALYRAEVGEKGLKNRNNDKKKTILSLLETHLLHVSSKARRVHAF